MTEKPVLSTGVVKTASGRHGQVIRIKKNFLNTLPLAANPSNRGEFTYTRRLEGRNTDTAVKNYPDTKARAITCEKKSLIAIENAATKTKRVRLRYRSLQNNTEDLQQKRKSYRRRMEDL